MTASLRYSISRWRSTARLPGASYIIGRAHCSLPGGDAIRRLVLLLFKNNLKNAGELLLLFFNLLTLGAYFYA